jgi:hypothetical protein
MYRSARAREGDRLMALSQSGTPSARRRPPLQWLTTRQAPPLTFRPPGGIYGYARVITVAQADEGESLDVQQRTIAGYAQMHGPMVERVRVFVERGMCPRREALIPGASAPARSAAREPGQLAGVADAVAPWHRASQ